MSKDGKQEDRQLASWGLTGGHMEVRAVGEPQGRAWSELRNDKVHGPRASRATRSKRRSTQRGMGH